MSVLIDSCECIRRQGATDGRSTYVFCIYFGAECFYSRRDAYTRNECLRELVCDLGAARGKPVVLNRFGLMSPVHSSSVKSCRMGRKRYAKVDFICYESSDNFTIYEEIDQYVNIRKWEQAYFENHEPWLLQLMYATAHPDHRVSDNIVAW